MSQYALPRTTPKTGRLPKSTPREPESYFPEFDTAPKQPPPTAPKQKLFTQMYPSELPAAEKARDDWYAQRGVDRDVLEQMYGPTDVMESTPPEVPTLRDEIAKQLMGKRLSDFTADWLLPIDPITDASYAVASGDPKRMATQGGMEGGSFLASLMVPKALQQLWKAGKLLSAGTPELSAPGLPGKEDRWPSR